MDSRHDTDKQILEEIRDNTRITAFKLFGSEDAEVETEHGRLPTLERMVKSHEDRLKKDSKMWDRVITVGLVLLFLLDHGAKILPTMFK